LAALSYGPFPGAVREIEIEFLALRRARISDKNELLRLPIAQSDVAPFCATWLNYGVAEVRAVLSVMAFPPSREREREKEDSSEHGGFVASREAHDLIDLIERMHARSLRPR